MPKTFSKQPRPVCLKNESGMSVSPVIYGLRVRWAGTPFLFPLRGCKFPPFFFPTLLQRSPFSKKKATPPALWRGVIDFSPLLEQKEFVRGIFRCNCQLLSFSRRRLKMFNARTSVYGLYGTRCYVFCKRFNLWK